MNTVACVPLKLVRCEKFMIERLSSLIKTTYLLQGKQFSAPFSTNKHKIRLNADRWCASLIGHEKMLTGVWLQSSLLVGRAGGS